MGERDNVAREFKNPANGYRGKSLPAEQTQADLKRALEFALKKLQIVGSVTRHDVLNQLTAVVGYNELLGMMVEDPKQRSFIEKEKQAIDKIRRQFSFAKDYQNIGIEPPRWQLLKTGSASIYADPLFEKVFANLFENTLRHSGAATEIRISIIQKDAGNVLVVEDNGTGIPVDDKTRVFERGYGQGTGWGLFLAMEILAFTGMTITETGETGKGTRFEIFIPQDNIRDGGEPQVPAHQ
jgi:signal transduction histidine kinase